MKIIDLLNKIANGEEVPKEIEYERCLLSWDNVDKDYYCEEYGNLFEYLFREFQTTEHLNFTVEILEEEKKIPEKIPEEIIVGKKQPTHRIKKIEKKINEIISYLDYLKSKGE